MDERNPMSKQHKWQTEEDIERNLILFAEYGQPRKDPLPVPDVIRKFEEQMKVNRKSRLTADVQHTNRIVISGRGKGLKDRIIRPGEVVEGHPDDDIELSKSIRSSVGIGFSNHLIENHLAASSEETESDTNNSDVSDSKFHFVPLSTSSSSSSHEPKTSPENVRMPSNRRKFYKEQSSTSSDTSSHSAKKGNRKKFHKLELY